jgi:hypothetical protein
LPLKVDLKELGDTSSITVNIDTVPTTIEKSDSITSEPVNYSEAIMGGVSPPPDLKPDISVTQPDTTTVSVPIMVGKIACNKPNKKSEPRKNNQTTKGQVVIMGDLMY